MTAAGPAWAGAAGGPARAGAAPLGSTGPSAPSAAAAGALQVAVHDVAPRWLAEVRVLRELLGGWGVSRVTHLVVPHFHRGVRLADDGATVAWLRDRATAGDELALHGYHHVQATSPTGWTGRVRARLWTAGEGECLAPAAPLRELLSRGRDELARCLGVAPIGFVAPAWLEPPGLGALLSELGFAWHETSFSIEALPSRRRLLAPVVGFATRTRARELASVAWAGVVLPVALARRRPLVRIAVHPADLRSPRVLAALERCVLAAAHLPSRTIGELAREL